MTLRSHVNYIFLACLRRAWLLRLLDARYDRGHVRGQGAEPGVTARHPAAGKLPEAGKVKNRTLANLSAWPEAKVEALSRVLKGQPPPAADLDGAFEITRSLPHGTSPPCWARCGTWGWPS